MRIISFIHSFIHSALSILLFHKLWRAEVTPHGPLTTSVVGHQPSTMVHVRIGQAIPFILVQVLSGPLHKLV